MKTNNKEEQRCSVSGLCRSACLLIRLTALFFTGLFSLTSCLQSQTLKDTVENISAESFKERIAANEGVIIDLRTPEEVKRGFIKGALAIDFMNENFEEEIAKLDKEKICYIYCESGGRSADAAAYMKKQGFAKIYNLEKGFFNWRKKGFEFVTE